MPILRSKIAAKSVNLPLFTLLTIANGRSRWSACSSVLPSLVTVHRDWLRATNF